MRNSGNGATRTTRFCAAGASIGLIVVGAFSVGAVQPAFAQRPIASGTPSPPVGEDVRLATKKMNAYVELLNTTIHVASALESYARTVDPKSGPTKARHVEPSAPSSIMDAQLAAAEKAAGETPAFPATDKTALAYIAAYRAAGPVIVRYVAYYNRKDHLADNYKGAALLHAELMPHLVPLISTRKAFDAAVETTKADIDQRELADIEAREGKSYRWHMRSVLIQARKTIVHFPTPERPQVDMARLTANLDTFATGVRAFDDYVAANPNSGDASASVFNSRPGSVLAKVREVHAALVKVGGDTRRLDLFAGTKIMLAVNDYNLMTRLTR